MAKSKKKAASGSKKSKKKTVAKKVTKEKTVRITSKSKAKVTKKKAAVTKKKPVAQAVKKIAKKASRKVTKKATKKVTKKVAKKVAKKPIQKTNAQSKAKKLTSKIHEAKKPFRASKRISQKEPEATQSDFVVHEASSSLHTEGLHEYPGAPPIGHWQSSSEALKEQDHVLQEAMDDVASYDVEEDDVLSDDSIA